MFLPQCDRPSFTPIKNTRQTLHKNIKFTVTMHAIYIYAVQ